MLRSAVPAASSSSSSSAPVASSWQERIAGGRITTAAPAFSKDGDFLITCAASLLKVYSVKTGEVVKALRHKSVITGFFFNPANALQLYSATEEGIIRLWDFEDGVLLKSWKIGGEGKIAQAVLDATHSVAYLRVIKTSGKETHYISTFNLCNHTSRVRYTSAQPLSDLYVSPQGDFFAVLFADRKGFYLFDVNSLTRHSFTHKFTITAFDFHPTDRCVAYGDQTGVVRINYCLPHTDNGNVEMSEAADKSAPSTNNKRGSQKKRQQQIVKLEWHTTPISALHFSPDGYYLFTGAQEEVLVLWRLHSNEKIFVPRLGAGIASVTLNEQATVYAVCCTDNSIRIIDALSRNLLMAIQGISLELERMPIAIEPRNSLIVTSFKNGYLQHYDPVRDKHVEELEVVSNPQVFFSEREKVPMGRVTRVAYGPKGSYMITVDERPASDINAELRLKFWTHDGKQYVLNTEADKPHSTSITGLACHPILPLVATCSKDGKFKLWEQRAKPPMPGAKDQNSKLTMWVCRSVGDYKGLPASAISFSTDGSLLAVAYQSTITLWDPMATTFHRSLTFTNCNAEKITHVAFAPSSRYLISATKTQLFVWDLLRCAVVWSYLIEVKDLAVDLAVNFKANLVFPSPSSLVSCFAVTDGNFIFLFNPASSRPLHVWKVEKHKAISLAFEATSSLLPEGRVVYLNDKSELVYLEKKLEKKPEKTDEEKVTLSMTKVNMRKEPPKEEKLPGFEHAFGKLSLSQQGSQVRAEDVGILVPREDAGALYNPSAPQLSRLFNGPSHLLPSPAKICSSFMEGLLKKAHTYVAPVTTSIPEAAQQPEDASNEGGDSAMQIDAAVPPDTQTQQTSGVLANGALDDAQTSKNQLKKQSKATEKVFYDSMFKFFSSYAARDEEAEMPASLLDELTATVAQPKKPSTPKKNAEDKEKAVATEHEQATTTTSSTTTTTTTTTVTPTKNRRQKKRASQPGTGADQVEDAMAVDGDSSSNGKEGQANGTAKSSKTTPRRRRKSAQQQQD